MSGTIPLIVEGTSADELETMLAKELPKMEERLGIKLHKESGRTYSVLFYMGEDPDKGGLIGRGKTYEEAVSNAKQQSPVELTAGYNQSASLRVDYALTKKEVEKMKNESKPPVAGRTPGYATRRNY